MRFMARGAALLALLFLVSSPASFLLSGEAEEPPAAPSSPAKEPIELRLPPDLEYKGAAEGPGVVVFRHSTHVALTENNCLACHNPPDPIFKILHPAHHTSHEEMEAGKTCGACHDDKKAFGITNTDNCQNCHSSTAEATAPAETPAPAGAAAAPRGGPKDVHLVLNEGSPGAVTFRHSSHGGAQAKCARCHPSLFPMKASRKPLDYQAMLEGATCGTCHNGKEAFGVDDSAYCERCHATEGSTP